MNKKSQYEALLPQARALLEGESDPIARMANLAALLHGEMGFWWTGFYRVQGDELVLGPFQGPVACTRICRGRGVCGTSWEQGQTLVVPDVDLFPGHIACSAASRSEIVVPLWHEGRVIAVLDIDSREKAAFDETDRFYLEQMAALIYGTEKEIWLAAGCFWGAQKFFKRRAGVLFTETGYANGHTDDPSYEEVYTDRTGYVECVHVRYNPDRITLAELARQYFRIIDPLSVNKQGGDEGTRYRTGIYYTDERDRETLESVFNEVRATLGVPAMAVELLPLTRFVPAEEYHQDYLDKHPDGYCHIPASLFLPDHQA